jgi:hypothetical protein
MVFLDSILYASNVSVINVKVTIHKKALEKKMTFDDLHKMKIIFLFECLLYMNKNVEYIF